MFSYYYKLTLRAGFDIALATEPVLRYVSVLRKVFSVPAIGWHMVSTKWKKNLLLFFVLIRTLNEPFRL